MPVYQYNMNIADIMVDSNGIRLYEGDSVTFLNSDFGIFIIDTISYRTLSCNLTDDSVAIQIKVVAICTLAGVAGEFRPNKLVKVLTNKEFIDNVSPI